MSVNKVPRDRWRQAQEWELALWNRTESKRGWRKYVWPFVRPFYLLAGNPEAGRDDHNHWWAKHFDNYSFLPDRMDNYIELGCGPYTNTRIILNNRQARHVVCSDPLIKSYLDYKGTWLSRSYRDHSIAIDDHPSEECPYAADYFDVVVMINVLDHVMDAGLCLENAVRITKKGGHFLFGQDLTNEEDFARYPDDTGHPIRLSLEDVEPYLRDLVAVHRVLLERDAGRAPAAHYATLLFAGRKKT